MVSPRATLYFSRNCCAAREDSTALTMSLRFAWGGLEVSSSARTPPTLPARIANAVAESTARVPAQQKLEAQIRRISSA